ncbi:hypothetical protein ACFL1H_04515 [Nanoarchaeota archaeon]
MSKKRDEHLVLYTYDISKVDKVKKVRFVFALKGRKGGIGLVKELGGKFLVPGCFIIPIKSDKEMQEIFKLWEIKYFRQEVQFL